MSIDIEKLKKTDKEDLLIVTKSYYEEFGKHLKPHHLIQIGYNLSTDNGWMEVPAKYLINYIKDDKVGLGELKKNNSEKYIKESDIIKIFDIMFDMFKNDEIDINTKNYIKFLPKKWQINKKNEKIKVSSEKLFNFLYQKIK